MHEPHEKQLDKIAVIADAPRKLGLGRVPDLPPSRFTRQPRIPAASPEEVVIPENVKHTISLIPPDSRIGGSCPASRAVHRRSGSSDFLRIKSRGF